MFGIISLFTAGDLARGEEIKKIILLGDSITEGYGVSRDQAYPTLVQKRFDADGLHIRVVNAGISGSTSASAPSRVSWQLKQKPELVVLALGANDGLRGLPVRELEKNLARAIELCQKAKVRVMLAGMRVPPNLGETYAKDFAAVYQKLIRKYSIPGIDFLLKDVGGVAELNQSDGIHPNEKGHAIVAKTVYEALKKIL